MPRHKERHCVSSSNLHVCQQVPKWGPELLYLLVRVSYQAFHSSCTRGCVWTASWWNILFHHFVYIVFKKESFTLLRLTIRFADEKYARVSVRCFSLVERNHLRNTFGRNISYLSPLVVSGCWWKSQNTQFSVYLFTNNFSFLSKFYAISTCTDSSIYGLIFHCEKRHIFLFFFFFATCLLATVLFLLERTSFESFLAFVSVDAWRDASGAGKPDRNTVFVYLPIWRLGEMGGYGKMVESLIEARFWLKFYEKWCRNSLR